MEEARKAEKKKKSKKPKISWWDVESNCHFYTTEEICDIKLKEALDKGLEEPYFDYRLDYEAGNRIWFININALTKQAHIDELTIGTVYPRMIMGRLEKGETVTIPYEEREFVFSTPKDAEKKLSVRFASEYADYLELFGIAAVNGHELTGLSSSALTNVIEVTKEEKRDYW
jgi:hypothetical protein